MSAVSAVRSLPISRLAVASVTLLVAATAVIAGAAPATASAATSALPTLNWPPPQPVWYDPLLQVSEIVANSPNAGGTDAFEYVEVRNATDAPLAWDDFTVRYIYPLVDHTEISSVAWPTLTPGAVIEPGGTLVLWVRNAGSAGKTAQDFNEAYGTSLVRGKTLVDIEGSGLANSVMRGIEVSSRAGVQVSRAFYNEDGAPDATVTSGVQFGSVTAEGAVQPRLGLKAPSPGAFSAAQSDAPLMEAPAAGTEPRILDEAPSTFTPGTAITLDAWITDDALVHGVQAELETDLDPLTTYDLVVDELGMYGLDLGRADTVGRSELKYRFLATDGFTTVEGPLHTLHDAAVGSALRIGGGHGAQPIVDMLAEVTPARLTREDGDDVTGTALMVAGGDTFPPVHELSIDGERVDGTPELEHEPIFAFDATLTNPYFRNGVVVNGDTLAVFDEGFFGDTRIVEASVPLSAVNPGEDFSVRIYSGTKAAPMIDPNEVNDDFVASNVRLALPDGRVLRPLNIADPTEWIDIGDNAGAADYLEATFRVPDDAFTALAYEWDTTAAADGEHLFTATDGTHDAALRVNVDNTGPEVVPSLASGSEVRGDMTLDADVSDGGAGLATVSATLDGAAVRLPYAVSSLTAGPGDHLAVITATDHLGNATEVPVSYSIPAEKPTVASAWPNDGRAVGASTTVAAVVNDASGDDLDVTIARGEALALGDDVAVSVGAATDALAVERTEARAITAAEATAMGSLDGRTVETGSDGKLPYILIDATLAADSAGQAHIKWDGSANANAKVLLYVLDPATAEWVEADRYVTAAADSTQASADAAHGFSLEATVAVDTYAPEGRLLALVQHSEGFAGDNLSAREDAADLNHPEDTPRSQYDFTLAWESDTQYYNASADIYDRQTSIHDYLLREREDLNLQYMVHTGDIVDWAEEQAQWERADPAYRKLDEAGLPYGVLAGNHDVNQRTNDYTEFSKLFGDARFAQNPWFGGSLQDNRGHYDLITAGGIDFLFLYMGWGAGDEQIDWMNEVLAQYPERVAMISLHEYMLTTGGLGPLPQRIFDEVVATNPNVQFVLSGHYHDAFTRLDSFDDDGDGENDRTVTSMLFDYQDLPHGGDGYLRLLHFDSESQTISVRTYSDYMRDYNAVNEVLDAGSQEFVIPYARAGIEAPRKVLVTDAISVDVLGDEVIARFEAVAAGSVVETQWQPGDGASSWYLRAVDPYGAEVVTDVREIEAQAAADEPYTVARAQPGVVAPQP